MKTFKFITLGCKVNQYETQLMREQLLNAGFKEVDSGVTADYYVINTCTVTSDADRESRRFIRHSMKENPKAAIIVTGCYVEKDADIIKAIDKKIIILDNKDKGEMGTVPLFANMAAKAKRGQSPFLITHFKDHVKAFIKVQDGCDNFCSFCKVPYVRGKPKSRNKKDILKEAKALIGNGYKELVLTGICLGAYGKDLAEKSPIEEVLNLIINIEGDFRVRLSSIEMQDVTNGLVNIIKSNSKVCRHLHIPLQSGDDRILKLMNRKYTALDFIKKIKATKKMIPNIAISTDVIVGFPGEDDRAFNNTIKCLKVIEPMRTHIFSYSRRPYTAAYHLKPDINQVIIKQRYNTIKRITDKLAEDYFIFAKKMPQRVLIENTPDNKTQKLCGYTDTYVKILIDGPDSWMNQFVRLPF